MIADWAKKYVGIPFQAHGRTMEGFDCWGCVRLVHEQEFGIVLPELDGNYTILREISSRSKLIERNITDIWVKMTAPKPGTVILTKMKGLPIHVMVYVGDNYALDTTKIRGHCRLSKITGMVYKNAIHAMYRHRQI